MVGDTAAPQPLTLEGATIEILPGALETLGTRVTARLPGRRIAIVSDQGVAHLYGERALASFTTTSVPPHLISFAAGEKHKTRATWGTLTDQLVSAGFGRDSAIVALGGGVTGDLAGFVAATYLRGVPLVQVPTTLLAMIDASIGGKTGVDTPAGKNLVGAFHHPALVLIDPRLLSTLPTDEVRSGLAEAIKHGVIADAAYFAWIATQLRQILHGDHPDDATSMHLVRRSVEIKVQVVRTDTRESGLRKILNFGHTIAHAIELVTGFGVSHGAAVSIGMVAEARLAEHLQLAQAGLADAITTVCDAAGLPVRLPDGVSSTEVVSATRTDKKAREGKVEYALPTALGSMAGEGSAYGIRASDTEVHWALEHL